jgi:hypothetical protein
MSVNTPVTTWRDTSGLTEYVSGDVNYIVDTTGTFLVDPSAVFIVDTGVLANKIPVTIWEEDDSI